MARLDLLNTGGAFRRRSFGLFALLTVGLWGCSSLPQQEAALRPGPVGVNRRLQLWRVADPFQVGAATTHPAKVPQPPVDAHRLNNRNIIRLLYERSPLVTASREEMIAAQHGLQEFRTNLSRLEPFAQVSADTSRFPERRDSKGVTGEIVGGLEKETFEGAVMRLEGGVSGSRVRFGDGEADQEETERGSGALVRARFELPFVGSRKRQNRVISQAFQESRARKAALNYLGDYRSYVANALSYYQSALLYLNYIRAYQRKLASLQELLDAPGLRPEDRSRLQSMAGDAKVVRDQYEASYGSYLLYLLEYVGISPEEEYVLEEDADAAGLYLQQSSTSQGLREMLEEAYLNNPRFQVLRGAIEDAELQRSQAILGKFDITAFVEGAQFPFGAETFDDRVGGWQIGAGLAVRLNDRRVLTASRKKAEAEIRQYRVQIEAEQLSVQGQIATQTDKLRSHHDTRPQILENIEKTTAEFEERRRIYFSGQDPPLTIDDVLAALNSLTSAEIRLAVNRCYAARAENALMAATGEVYWLVGLSVKDNGHGLELAVTQ